MSTPRPTPSLSHVAVRGFFWMTTLSMVAKVVGFLAQIILARLLIPDQFGLVSLAYTVSTFGDLIQSYGLRQVLVQRRMVFSRWASPAMWLALAIGFGAAAMMAIAAPIASSIYAKGPDVAYLILILAITAPINAIGIVPEAILQQDLRFKMISLIQLFHTVGLVGGNVLLAWLGYGAYAFVLSNLIICAMRTLAVLWLTKPTVRLNPQFRFWKSLVPDTVMLIVAAAVINIMTQGDKLALGLFHPEQIVGLYFFSYNLSLQAAVLIGQNLSRILFPVLSKLQDDPKRLLHAFRRASRTMMFLGAPLGLMQVPMAGPFIHGLVQKPEWEPTILVIQILSVGMVIHLAWQASRSLLQAGGRFRLYLISASIYAAIFMASVITASWLGGLTTVTLTVAIVFSAMTIFDTYLGVRGLGGGLRDVISIYAKPMILASFANAIAWGVSLLIPELPRVAGFPLQSLLQLALIPIVTLVIYMPLFRLIAPGTWNELMDRVLPAASRLPILRSCAPHLRVNNLTEPS